MYTSKKVRILRVPIVEFFMEGRKFLQLDFAKIGGEIFGYWSIIRSTWKQSVLSPWYAYPWKTDV